MTRFQKIVECFNNLETEFIFNVSDFAEIFNQHENEKIESKHVHSFLSPARRLGIVLAGDIIPPPTGRGPRKEYLKVRSFTDEEIHILSRRSDAIDFTKTLKDLDFLMTKQDMVTSIKKLISNRSNCMSDAEIAEQCSVSHAFVSRVRSDMIIPKKKLYYKPKSEKETELKTYSPSDLPIDNIEDGKYYPVLGSSLKILRAKFKSLQKAKAELLDENSYLNTQNKILQEKLSRRSSDHAVDLQVLMQ